MRKLIQALMLTLALTASIHGGEIGQPVVAPSPSSSTVTAQGDMPNGIIEIGSALLKAWLSLF